MSTKNNIILQNCGFSTTVEKEESSTIDIKVQALHTGIFFDMNGTEVVVDREMIENIKDHYNESAKLGLAIEAETDPSVAHIKLEDFDNRNAPNQVNHDATDAMLTVGSVIGLMSTKEINGKTYLFCNVRVKGVENVARVKDKRFRNVSIQFNPETYEFVEISWVVKGAAFEARSMLAKGDIKVSSNSFINLDTIQAKQQNIIKLRKELEATKHLIALAKVGTISRVQVNKIKNRLSEFDDPKAIVELMESVVPSTNFKPKYINDQPFIKFLKGEEMASKAIMSGTKDPFQALMEAGNVSLSTSDIQHSNIGDDCVLEYSEVADRHAELMEKSMLGYESGDMEMGRKFGDMAKKLAIEVKSGKAKLSDYDIEKESKDSDDVKELAKRIKAAEDDMKKEVNEKLAAMEERMTILLSKNQPAKEEMKDIKDAIILLTKKVVGE